MSRIPHWTFGQLHLQSDFKKWFFRNLFQDSRFQNHPDSLILQKYQSLSNQRFKHNSAHMPSLKWTPKLSFKPIGFAWSSLTFTAQKTNACCPSCLQLKDKYCFLFQGNFQTSKYESYIEMTKQNLWITAFKKFEVKKYSGTGIFQWILRNF